MKEVKIKSSSSDLVLILSEYTGQYFTASIDSFHLKALRRVYAAKYAADESSDFLHFIEELASSNKPWIGQKEWRSLEGEFQFLATCDSLGKIIFKVTLSDYHCSEEWVIDVEIDYEFGQLKDLAISAKSFFKRAE